MQQFRDSNNRVWKITLTGGDIMRVRDASDRRFNLFDPDWKIDNVTLKEAIDSDYTTLWELLWYIVEPQAIEQGITAEAYGQAMAGECIDAARSAFMREWAFFFRQLQKPEVAAMLERMQTYHERAVEAIKTKLNSPEMKRLDTKIESAMPSVLSKSFGNLEASVDAILARSLGDNSTTSPEASDKA